MMLLGWKVKGLWIKRVGVRISCLYEAFLTRATSERLKDEYHKGLVKKSIGFLADNGYHGSAYVGGCASECMKRRCFVRLNI